MTTATAMSATEFNALMARIPYRANHATARGVLAPLVRSMGHILFLLAAVYTDTQFPESVTLTEEEAKNELDHAASHLDATAYVDAPGLSSIAKTNLTNYAIAVNAARDSYELWSQEERLECLRNLANRAAGIAASLDRELIGLLENQSDAGTSL